MFCFCGVPTIEEVYHFLSGSDISTTRWFHFGRSLFKTVTDTPYLEQPTSIICLMQPLGETEYQMKANNTVWTDVCIDKSSAVKKYKMNLATASIRHNFPTILTLCNSTQFSNSSDTVHCTP